jgi:lysophospholipase L1-like esterase
MERMEKDEEAVNHDVTSSASSASLASFVALGDSFTEGLNDYGPDGGYIGWADRAAGIMAAQVPGFRYANLAVRGKLVRHMVEEQISPAIAMAPDLVSVAAGGNDILRGADVDNLAELFDAGVARLREAGCRVLIFTGFDPRPLPVIRLLRGRIAAYNMHLRAIADERGCDLVDLWSMRALRDPRAWSPDRLHLTAAGHRSVALRACAVLGLPVTADARTPLAFPAASAPAPVPPGLAASGPVPPGLAASGPVPPGLAAPALVPPGLAAPAPAPPGLAAPALVPPGLAASGPVPPGLAAPSRAAAAGGRSAWLAARRADAAWAKEYAIPWVRRRLRHTSSGDGVPPKRPELLPVQ